MKPLKPSLKEKKRYVVFEIISKDNHSVNDVSQAIKNKIKEFLGIKESGKAGIMFINNLWQDKTQKGVIRVNSKYVDDIRACFATLKEINCSGVLVRSLGVSGTIKKANAKYLI